MKAKKLPFGLRFLFGFLSTILSVALFATAVVAIVLADIRVLTSEDNLQVIISHVMFGTPIQKNGSVAPQAVGGMKLEETNSSSSEVQQLIVDALYNFFGEQYGEEIPFTEEDVQELLDQSTLPDFLSGKMAGIMSDIYTGDITTTITGEEVAQLLEENKTLIEDTFGIEVSEEYLTQIVEKVEEMDMTGMVQNVLLGKPVVGEGDAEGGELENENAVLSINSPLLADGVIKALVSGQVSFADIMSGGIPVILAAVRELTSAEALLAVLGVCAVLIALLFVVNLKQLHVAFRYVGVTAMAAGLPFAAASVAAFAVPSLFVGTLLSIVYLGLTLTAGVSIGVFVGGLALFVVSIVLSVIYKKNLKTPCDVVADAAPVVPEMPELTVEKEIPTTEEVSDEPQQV